MKHAYDIVTLARKVTRPTALEYFNYILDDFVELHGDRSFQDDKAVVGGVGLLRGRPVTAVGIQKGHDLEENMERNFGMPHPEGYRKTLRLMKQAEKFNRPVIALVNTSGAFSGVSAEERGQGEAIARNLFEMSGLRTPIISIVIGEGGSGGALALALADRVWMLSNTVYSVLSPEGFASILWKDSSRAKEAAQLMKLTAKDLLELEVIEKIIEEAREEDENYFEITADRIRDSLTEELNILCDMDIDMLLEKRYERFRRIGEFEER